MGKYVKRQTPKGMPSQSRVEKANEPLDKRFFVVGCRGDNTRDNREPDAQRHSQYSFVTGDIESLSDKRLILFIHGYNITPDDGLNGAQDLFSLFHSSVTKEGIPDQEIEYLLFTWPGDTGPVYFNAAQRYAHFSGVALFRLLWDAFQQEIPPKSVSLIPHSLGAHVGLRALSILGERNFHGRASSRVESALLLAPAVEDDVFRRPERSEEYHFPETAFGLRRLHIFSSRSDDVLGGAFKINEWDRALGFMGPESMQPLVSLARRVTDVLGDNQTFRFELHDLSPNTATMLNSDLVVRSHGGYWENQAQTDFYVNFVGIK